MREDQTMLWNSFGKRTAAGLAATLASFALLPGELAAQGLPVETGSHLPVWLWFIGAAVLGLALAYGVMRNRRRTRADKAITERATKDLYTRENRNS
jgi:membrane protease YdiL (CAAX protease family)